MADSKNNEVKTIVVGSHSTSESDIMIAEALRGMRKFIRSIAGHLEISEVDMAPIVLSVVCGAPKTPEKREQLAVLMEEWIKLLRSDTPIYSTAAGNA